MAIERPKFLLEMQEIKPEDIILSFKAMRAIPFLDLLEGYLKKDVDKTKQFYMRYPWIKDDRNTLSQWAANHFRDLFNQDDKETIDIASKYTSRELMIVGYVYLNGLGVAEDMKKAFYFFQLAARTWDPVALCEVGNCYDSGTGVDKNEIEAERHSKEAYRLGYLAAGHNLAMTIHDATAALNLHIEVAKNGSSSSLLALGVRFLAEDRNIAIKCFAIAASQGHKAGISNYGFYAVSGEDNWKYIRLGACAGYDVAQGRLQACFLTSARTPALIYHATFGLKASALPELLAKLKNAFSDLCETNPEEVMRLSKELDDKDSDIFSLLDDVRQEKLARASSFMLSSVAEMLLPMPVLKITCEYLSISMVTAIEKEVRAKTAAQMLVAQKYNSSLFSQSVERADQGEISYQRAMRNSF